ncbi:DMT family transporter [Vreelandella janggokensis]|uniref:DMT family transporter n=1 Tax=Vreelandella janggokensis TaxID=370767 RepID=UPI002864F542|nr:DMT family transporter [Halomonas janggokensis]MDR5886196.1 DMT family transporter [Halomonas janggokensis]
MVSTKTSFAASCVFVLLWSTGFIVGRMIVGSASPNIFLALRFFLSCLLFTILALGLNKKCPPLSEWHKHAIAGFFINGIYLGGSYWAIAQGFPAALMALFGALQPVITMIILFFLIDEKLSRLQGIGILIGLSGVIMVLLPSIETSGGQNYSPGVLLIAAASILSITWGTILQKSSIASSELLPSMAIQNAFAAVTSAALIILLDESTISLDFNFIFALVWAIIVLSGVGTFLLIWLIRHGNTTQTTSLLLLAPPLAAIEAWLLFGEQLSLFQITGFALSLTGVAVCRKISVS